MGSNAWASSDPVGPVGQGVGHAGVQVRRVGRLAGVACAHAKKHTVRTKTSWHRKRPTYKDINENPGRISTPIIDSWHTSQICVLAVKVILHCPYLLVRSRFWLRTSPGNLTLDSPNSTTFCLSRFPSSTKIVSPFSTSTRLSPGFPTPVRCCGARPHFVFLISVISFFW